MTSRLTAAVLFLAVAFVSPPLASAQPLGVIVKEEAIELPFGKANWDMRRLEEDPVKLVKVSAVKVQVAVVDPGSGRLSLREVTLVNFLLEFQRDLTVRDPDWTGPRPQPPFRFQFEDAEGVTLASESAEYGGAVVGAKGRLADLPAPRALGAEYGGVPVGVKGRRVRVVLDLPEARVVARTKKVVIDHKPYGE